MAYKKYIKRGGKVYGPYIYHSKRVDGKVVSEYRGTHSKKIDYKKFLWIGLGILVISLLAFGVSFLGKGISGKAVFDVKVDYKEGEFLDGVLKLSLNEGELLPDSSKLVFENNEERYEYVLADIISDEAVEGDFYVEGKEVSGSGSGYGIEGTKEASSIVYFTLEIYEDQNIIEEPEELVEEIVEEPEEPEELVEEIVEEPEEIVEEIIEESEEEEPAEEIVEEPVQEVEEIEEEATEGPGITGGVISSFFGWMGTGRVVMELQTGIDGQVSVDNPFTYSLSEGQTAEIKSKSVRTDSEDLNDNVIDLEIISNEVIVTTDYFEEEEGFGQDYLGENVKSLKIDLSNLNLMLSEGDLKISLIYSEEELISLTTVLQEGETSEAQVKEGKEIIEEVVIPSGVDLTEAERAILINEFGEENIKKIRSEIDNGRLKIGYKLREYKIEYSYDNPMDEKIRELQMEADRTKWLKNIAATLLRKASVPQQKDTGEDSFPID